MALTQVQGGMLAGSTNTTTTIQSNGTTAMTIDSSQNVGIGNTVASTINAVNGVGNLVVGSGSGSEGITIYTGTTDTGGIAFADGTTTTDTYRGYINYAHSTDHMAFWTAATERMRIDSSGRLTMTSQPSFRAYATSSQSPGPGAVIVFNNDSATGMFNTGSHYNTSNGRFTAPVTGVYALTASVLYQSCSNGQYGDTSIYRNGGTMINYNRRQYQSTYTGYGGYFEAQISVVVKLTAGDYVTINNGSANTQSLYVNDTSWTWFSGWLLG